MPLNDCLSLFPIQALNRQELKAGWRMAIATLGEGEDRGFPRLDFDDDAWSPAAVPRLHGATTGNEAIWYRLRFPRPRHRQRTLLRFDGAFLVANVWLNGKLLGSHYGYFAPFTFDISSFLLEENVLAVCIESPVETDLAAKRHLMGVFNDSDAKPYPSHELGALSDQYVWHVPMGLWQPVWLEQVGHVVAEWVHCQSQLEQGDLARLRLRTRLRNLDGRIMNGELTFRVEPDNFQGPTPLEMRRAFRLNGHEVQDVVVELGLPDPQCWYPWAHGDPALYRAEVEVTADERRSAELKETFGIRDIRLQTRAEGWTFGLNGRRMFMRGATYWSEFFLDAAGSERLRGDLDLARQANMDLLRLNAHLEPPALYDAADRSGLLLWQELPLTGSYVHRADARSVTFFRDAVLAQAEELSHLLFNHPSVVLYAVHNDPPWSRSLAWLGERHTEQLNRDVDEEAASLLRELDPSRPVIAGSGDQDVHCGIGWSSGDWRDLAHLGPGFVSEVGPQALPNANSPVWRHLNRGWPVADDDESWRYAGYQPEEWAASGIAAPSAHPSRDACIRASQEYQAHLLRFAIERWRREKFAHCGGVLIAQLVDGFPAISAAVLDHARRAKRAYRSVAEAFAPLFLAVDLPENDADVDGLLLRLPRGRLQYLRIVCVNDDPARHGRARLRWRIQRERAYQSSWWRELRAWFAKRRFSGHDSITIPDQVDPAAVIAEPVVRLHADGLYRISAELDISGDVIAQMEQRFLVGDPPHRPRRISADRADRLAARYPEALAEARR
ncbi:MAG TPA: glycoside hydrolase family 2 TIM barrel-domain containing protein [Candidatus Dormibacteraeota bacterium]|nr:glycoside hydrolase family 2 TIM barrel-domain containing protein [Candidatus Dormibacteraeota bacterium]